MLEFVKQEHASGNTEMLQFLKAIFQLVPSAQRVDGLGKTLLPVAFPQSS